MLEKFYYPPVNFWSVWFSESLLRFLKNNNLLITPNDIILDIGCGLGFHCFNLKPFSPSEVYGCDISQQTIEVINSFKTDIVFFKMDICADPKKEFVNKFTKIFSCDVFEHVKDPQTMLSNIFKLLKQDGIVCMTFPNNDYHGHNQIDHIESLK
jgi:2-polyprenyl-3-methyl-5-hydroxy-6-metoxy-1,4-benzoquinol methylase